MARLLQKLFSRRFPRRKFGKQEPDNLGTIKKWFICYTVTEDIKSKTHSMKNMGNNVCFLPKKICKKINAKLNPDSGLKPVVNEKRPKPQKVECDQPRCVCKPTIHTCMLNT